MLDEKKQEKRCCYKSPEDVGCKRSVDKTITSSELTNFYCIFHVPQTLDKIYRDTTKIKEEIEHLIAKKDGDWVGFVFPEKLKLENITIDFPIDMRWCSFKELSLSKIIFKNKVDFSWSTFTEDVSFRQINFEQDAYFINANFKGSVLFDYPTKFHERAFLNHCHFSGKTQIRCLFKGRVSLNSIIFADSTIFKGSRLLFVGVQDGTKVSDSVSANPSNSSQDTKKSQHSKNPLLFDFKNILNKVIQKKAQNISGDKNLRIFDSEVDMQEVEFRQPERTKFYMVNLSQARLIGTNFRGISFQNVLWQKKGKRKVIYDEIYIEKSNDNSFKINQLPYLEEAYRNLRITFEGNKDFSTANDFYIGEMEAKRNRKFFLQKYMFSIVALYYWLSRYGTSPICAISFFFIFVGIHLILTWILQDTSSILVKLKFEVSSVPIINDIQTFFACLINSLKVLTLQRLGESINMRGWLNLLDIIFGIIGPVQLSLIVLSLRTIVKRH